MSAIIDQERYKGENSSAQETKNALNPGDVLLFPQPTFLISKMQNLATELLLDDAYEFGGAPDSPILMNQLSDEFLDSVVNARENELFTAGEVLLNEYRAILEQLARVVGKDSILIVDTIGDPPANYALQNLFSSFQSTQIDDYTTIDRIASYKMFDIFQRDNFTQIGPFTFLEPLAFSATPQEDTVKVSPLGEGGCVISAGNAVLIAEIIFNSEAVQNDLEILRENGFRIASLPNPNHASQSPGKLNFLEGHIDGHANLIKGRDGKIYLLYLKSYANQDEQIRGKIQNAASTIRADTIEIDDTNLTNLALNFIQFTNGSIVCSPGLDEYDDSLIETLRDLVGSDKVYPTAIPIHQIPRMTAGSIRCMTNIISSKTLDSILSSN